MWLLGLSPSSIFSKLQKNKKKSNKQTNKQKTHLFHNAYKYGNIKSPSAWLDTHRIHILYATYEKKKREKRILMFFMFSNCYREKKRVKGSITTIIYVYTRAESA